MSDAQFVTLADRRAVYALLDRMLDWLPPQRLSVGRAERSASSNASGGWRPCGRCQTTGRVTGEGVAARACLKPHGLRPYEHRCRPCLNCDAGYIAVRVGGGDRMLDAGKHELDTAAQVKAERRRSLDAQIVKLKALAREHNGAEAPDDDLTRAVRAKERLYRTGSFQNLEYVLDLLQITRPLAREALNVFVIDRHFSPNPFTQARLDEIVDWVAGQLPRPILLPADARVEMAAWKSTLEHGRTAAHRAQREARNAEIVDLFVMHGWSLRRIAALYELSPEGVRKIVNASVGELAAVASGPAA